VFLSRERSAQTWGNLAEEFFIAARLDFARLAADDKIFRNLL